MNILFFEQAIGVLFSSFLREVIRWADLAYVPRFWYSAIPFARAYGKPVVTHLRENNGRLANNRIRFI